MLRKQNVYISFNEQTYVLDIVFNLLPGTHLSFCCRVIKFGMFDPSSPIWKTPKLYGKSSTQFWDIATFPCGNVAKSHTKTCQFMDFKNCRQFYIYNKNNVFAFAFALLLKLRLYFMHSLITVFMNVWANNIQVLRQKAVFWTNRCQNNQHPIHTCWFLKCLQIFLEKFHLKTIAIGSKKGLWWLMICSEQNTLLLLYNLTILVTHISSVLFWQTLYLPWAVLTLS